MTVSYTHEVATCTGWGSFWKLLFRWRGSVYKLVWPDLLLYNVLYYSLRLIYQLVLNDPQKRIFEKVCEYCLQFTNMIPVSFVLGFYVNIVVQRWWAQYQSIPWPDSLATLISVSIHGQDERSRLMRRTVMRYINLSQVMALGMISPKVKKRFPTLDHLVESGFMMENEKIIFEKMELKTKHPKFWMPIVWAGTIVSRARKEGRIRDDFAVKSIVDLLNTFRGSLCGELISYDWISIPLVYTQVVTLAVYSYFLGTLLGSQYLIVNNEKSIDLYVPWFTLLQFFFYMGWLKVAESLVNPFGDDDDDFEVNWIIDRNLQVSYMIVDEMHSDYPELIQDKYWDEVFPQELPYTVASEQYKSEPPQGSTAFIEVPQGDQEFLPLIEDIVESNDDAVENMENGSWKSSPVMNKVIPRGIQSNPSENMSFHRSSSQRSSQRKGSVLSNLLNKLTSADNVAKSKKEEAAMEERTDEVVDSLSFGNSNIETTYSSIQALNQDNADKLKIPIAVNPENIFAEQKQDAGDIVQPHFKNINNSPCQCQRTLGSFTSGKPSSPSYTPLDTGETPAPFPEIVLSQDGSQRMADLQKDAPVVNDFLETNYEWQCRL